MTVQPQKTKKMNLLKQNIYWLIYLVVIGALLALAIIFG